MNTTPDVFPRRDRVGSPAGRIAAGLFAAFLLVSVVAQVSLAGPETVWEPLVARLAADGVDRAATGALFASPGVVFDPSIMAKKVDSMVKNRFEPVTVTRRTLEKSNYRRFLDPWTISKAGRYMAENRALFVSAEKAYGVPAEVVAAILLVETKLGSYLGDREAFGVLASMALCSDFELVRPRLKNLKNAPDRTAFAAQAAKDKGDWAYAELKALLAYAAAKKISPLAIPGSIYGAIGICQFMPTNALKFGVDADNNGIVDLFVEADAIHSVANYLRGHGWREGQSEEERRAAIYSYNHSNLYVMAVLAVADKLAAKRPAS